MFVFALVQTSRRCVCVCVCLRILHICLTYLIPAAPLLLTPTSLTSSASSGPQISSSRRRRRRGRSSRRRISVWLNPSCNIPAGSVNVCDEYSRLVNNSWGLQRLRPRKRACPIRGPLISRTSRDTSHMSSSAGDTNRAGSETLNWSKVT